MRGLAERRRVVVTLPVAIIEEADRVAGRRKWSRSQVVLEALTCYLADQRRREQERVVGIGYQEMGDINLSLAEEGLAAENDCALAAGQVEAD